MARWFIYEVRWKRDTPPLPKNLAVANRRLKRADPDAPILTENATHVRWQNPCLTAEDVFRIMIESNANPGRVLRWECRCNDWKACDDGFAECGPRRPYRSEDAAHAECVWINEDFDRFYVSRLSDRPKAFRNIPRFIR